MKFFNLKIAGVFALAISFYTASKAQNANSLALFKDVNVTCESNQNPYLELGAYYNLWLTALDSSFNAPIKKVKFKSKELDFLTIDNKPTKVSAKPLKTGLATIHTKVTLEDGTKLKESYVWTVAELPSLQVEIVVTSPDSKFMWLNLIEKSTGQSANSSFNLCSIDFTLTDSLGNLKETGKSVRGDEYFPSVTLSKLPVQFQMNDRLKLEMIVTHYENNLPVFISQELIITSLWH